jgi:glycosyltransferase involved in cell wall biosynthesis
MSRIAQLSFYPTKQPMHGGQQRAHHIARVLEAAGHDIIRLPFFRWDHHDSQDEAPVIDLATGVERRRYPGIVEITDFTLSELIATDEDYFAIFAARMDEVQPDIVMLEEPWLWPAVRRWRSGRANPPPVIFNSYNVESLAKAPILAELDHEQAGAILAEIAALERDLAAHAAAVTVTTESDAAILRGWTSAPVVVACNGTTPRWRAQLRGILPAPLQPAHKFLLFVGSGHPPNATGFLTMAMPALARLRSHQRLVLAGGVCDLITARLEKLGPNALLRDRAVFLRQVSALGLDCLISNAAGILLPITYGGGSNLKTAEALASGLPVIGTSTAFRGFEAYKHLPQVTIADTPQDFADAVQRTLQANPPPREQAMVTALHWSSTLQPLIDLVNTLTPQAHYEATV